jgi:hypothetical protein
MPKKMQLPPQIPQSKNSLERAISLGSISVLQIASGR